MLMHGGHAGRCSLRRRKVHLEGGSLVRESPVLHQPKEGEPLGGVLGIAAHKRHRWQIGHGVDHVLHWPTASRHVVLEALETDVKEAWGGAGCMGRQSQGGSVVFWVAWLARLHATTCMRRLIRQGDATACGL